MRQARGFTLLEVLIALAIFALIGLATYQMLDSVLRTDASTRAHDRELRELVRALAAFERDVLQVAVRPVRDGYGEALPALQGDGEGAARLELTRAGWRNPQGAPRAERERVRWQLQDGQWQRLYWQVLDQAQDSQPQVQQALDGVTALSLRYLDQDGAWQDTWPPLTDTAEQRLTHLPLAVELRLQHSRQGELRRLLRLPEGLPDNPAEPGGEGGL